MDRVFTVKVFIYECIYHTGPLGPYDLGPDLIYERLLQDHPTFYLSLNILKPGTEVLDLTGPGNSK